jgi:hypothetical protein
VLGPYWTWSTVLLARWLESKSFDGTVVFGVQRNVALTLLCFQHE